jgi:hypothetical protein
MIEYIGGEFSYSEKSFLNISNKKNFSNFSWSTSGRSAFFNILAKCEKKNFNTVYLPAYVCDSLISPVKKLGFRISFYDLDENLNIKNEFKSNSIILVIHFFGKKIKSIDYIKKNIPKDSKLIEDFTHVFLNQNIFTKKKTNSFFFSLRKHFGFVTGAYTNEIYKKVIMNNKLLNMYERSIGILNFKYKYLNYTNDYDFEKEKFYLESIKQSENIINSNLKNYKILKKIKNFNNNISFEKIRKKRKNNWGVLNQLLKDKVECFHSNFEKNEVPFGFIIKVKNRDMIKNKLKNQNIFAPIHWTWQKEVQKRKFPKLYKLSKHILTLPVDQRYCTDDMERLAKKLKKII